MVAFQVPQDPSLFVVKSFKDAITVKDESEGCIARQLDSKILTTPHSAAIVDFDGDCMSDLFVTVKD